MILAPTDSMSDCPVGLAETADGPLVFQIRGSSRDGQIVRLRSRKCTVGSGPRCTLRLDARGVRPLHCLIIRGEKATVIRRWSGDTRLNGRTFADAELSPGDRLGIGPIELEVLDCTERFDVPPIPLQTDYPPRDEPDATAARLGLANRQGRRRTRSLIAELRSLREQLAQLEQRQSLAETNARNFQQTQEKTKQEAFEQQRGRWDAEQAETENRLAARVEELDTRAKELDDQQQAFEQECRQWEARREQSLVKTSSDNASTGTPPVEADELPVDTNEPPAGSEDPPVDAGELLARLGVVPLVPEDESQAESLSEPPAAEAEQTETSVPTTEPDHDGKEESIDDYMSRLMQRVRSVTGKPTSPDPCPRETPCSRKTTPSSPREASPPTAKPAASEEPEPATWSPRTAPETLENLSLLRELANASAHTAIHQHARKRMRGALRAKLLLAIVALAIGSLLIGIWSLTGAGAPAYYGGLAILLVALFWGVQYAVLTGRMIVNKSGHLDLKAADDSQQAADDEQEAD
jgi:predicted lipid-binding transport protein (Tim44 family)